MTDETIAGYDPEAFRASALWRFNLLGMGSLAVILTFALVTGQFGMQESGMIAALLFGVNIPVFFLLLQGKNELGAWWLILGDVGVLSVDFTRQAVMQSTLMEVQQEAVFLTVALMALFAIGPKGAYATLAVGLVPVFATHLAPVWHGQAELAAGLQGVMSATSMFVIAAVAMRLVETRTEYAESDLEQRLTNLQSVTDAAVRIGSGDLSQPVEGKGDAVERLRNMEENLRNTVAEIQTVSSSVASAVREIRASAQQHSATAEQQGASAQSALSGAATVMEQATSIVTESTGVTTESRRMRLHVDELGARLETLIRRAERVEETLARLENLSRKSEILALNAALEGHRAGEAGSGFALVAGRMRDLSNDSRELLDSLSATADSIREAAIDTMAALSKLNEQSERTMQTAHSIDGSARMQQRSLAESEARLRDIVESADQGTHMANTLLDASDQLDDLAGQLEKTVGVFRLE